MTVGLVFVAWASKRRPCWHSHAALLRRYGLTGVTPNDRSPAAPVRG